MEPISWLIAQLPIMMVGLAGSILSLVHLRHHRMVSLLTLAALALLFAQTLIGFVLQDQLHVRMRHRGPDIEAYMMVMSFIQSSLSTGLLALLLAAVFGWRTGEASKGSLGTKGNPQKTAADTTVEMPAKANESELKRRPINPAVPVS